LIRFVQYFDRVSHGNFTGYYETVNEEMIFVSREGESKVRRICFLMLGLVFCGSDAM